MAQEIERKFLLSDSRWRPDVAGERYIQAYVCTAEKLVVRVRLTPVSAFLTLKSKQSGMRRSEFEYTISRQDAGDLIELGSGCSIEKMRYKIAFKGKIWEIDIFEGDNLGLRVAEIELQDETEEFATPPWAGREVTDDPKFYNQNLSVYPYSMWTAEEKASLTSG